MIQLFGTLQILSYYPSSYTESVKFLSAPVSVRKQTYLSVYFGNSKKIIHFVALSLRKTP